MRKTVSGVYHVKCFVCSVCKRQLETGEQMYLVQVRRDGGGGGGVGTATWIEVWLKRIYS